MLFPTVRFAAFFAAVLPLAWLVASRPRARRLVLLAAGVVFYAAWDRRFVALLAAAAAVNWGAARAVAGARTPAWRRAALWAGIGADLAVLGWFKYYGFFATSLVDLLGRLGVQLDLHIAEVALPVGLSFWTFSAISYLVEVRREVIGPAPLLDVAVWLSFFPVVASGPIVRASEFLPQLARPGDRDHVDVAGALWLVGRGLFKKVVIASYLATLADPVFATPRRYSSLELLVAVYAFAAQLYADFSGYTDMARGCALFLGFRLPTNFDAPYAAQTVQEFWTRWHQTLSRWLRDFLLAPLTKVSGGSRRAAYLNLVLVMLAAGLWHGAGWTFLAFGAVHGVALAGERWRRDRRRRLGLGRPADTAWRRTGRRFVTFHVVCLGWVFFRAESIGSARLILGRLVTGWGPVPALTPLLLVTVAVVLAAPSLPRDLRTRAREAFAAVPPAVQVAAGGTALMVIDVLGPSGVPPFIYFQF